MGGKSRGQRGFLPHPSLLLSIPCEKNSSPISTGIFLLSDCKVWSHISCSFPASHALGSTCRLHGI
ncbi:hypothetical protein SLEP1_g11436 [Rubroshorea leprosula]|uniref:Uncharacterized protein n=1 Tax=Rubroshorea leprosula TaxID=152421 RepID=A0AAV5IFT6_9ROSI|nr:hypothetical protein SLEP1_g11436 [Rubroshorea leprosula]